MNNLESPGLPTGLDMDKTYYHYPQKTTPPEAPAAASAGLPTGLNLNESCFRSHQSLASAQEPASEEVLNAHQRELLRQLNDAKQKTECFGGLLFKRTDSTNQTVISFAVRDMTESELSQAVRTYNDLYRSQFCGIIPSAHPFVEQAPPYTFFNFLPKPYSESLREYCGRHNSQRIPAEQIMRKLVKMLVENYNYANGSYHAMNCLSMDTIFVDARKALWVLPLQAFRGCFPCQIAPEASDPAGVCDATADLYSAAYVSLEVANGGKLPEMLHVEDPMIRNCLLGIRQCRPKLEVVAESFSGSRSDPEPDDGYLIRPRRSVPASKPARKESGEPRFDFRAWFQSFWERMTNALSKLSNGEPVEHKTGTKSVFTRNPFRPIKPLRDEEDNV